MSLGCLSFLPRTFHHFSMWFIGSLWSSSEAQGKCSVNTYLTLTYTCIIIFCETMNFIISSLLKNGLNFQYLFCLPPPIYFLVRQSIFRHNIPSLVLNTLSDCMKFLESNSPGWALASSVRLRNYCQYLASFLQFLTVEFARLV
jgi:hypothetical protein